MTKLQLWCDLEDEVTRILKQRGEFFEDEYDIAEFEIDPIPIRNGTIDGILVFSDMTIEFHIKEEGDALNWSLFDIETIEKVLNNLKEI